MKLVKSASVLLGASLIVALSAPPSVAKSVSVPLSVQHGCVPLGGIHNDVNAGNAVDLNATVYVGGDYFQQGSAESEGNTVISGNAHFQGNRLFNMGVVGVGTQLTPPALTDMLRVGGDMSIEGSTSLDIAFGLGANARVGGALTDANGSAVPDGSANGKPLELNGGEVTSRMGSDAALGGFATWDDNNFEQLAAFAQRQPQQLETRPAQLGDSGNIELHGDGVSETFVFELTAEQLAAARSWAGVDYVNIPANATVVVKLVGAEINLRVSSVFENGAMVAPMSAELVDLASRTLWVADGPESVTITGGAQFAGSLVVPSQNTRTEINVPGFNGRVWVAGDLVHSGAGAEIHTVPFEPVR